MDTSRLERVIPEMWRFPPRGAMRVPAVLYADEALLLAMEDKVLEQLCNVAGLPGIVDAAYAMPDAHWGYGFPIGGVAAFDPEEGGVVSAGGVGFDVSCGVRLLTTGLDQAAVKVVQRNLAIDLFRDIPAGLGSRGKISLDAQAMDAMLVGGARWAHAEGYGVAADLERIEERGRMAGAAPDAVSEQAKRRQRDEMGTLGSGNHYLEVQEVTAVYDDATAAAFGLALGQVVVMIHCGSRGLGHQIGTEFLREMAIAAPAHGIILPDLELACAPIASPLGERYLGAMRAAINCALANRQILTHLARKVFAHHFPQHELRLVFDVSHNTCKEEWHEVEGRRRRVFVHRKGATRAFAAGHSALPDVFRATGQPIFIGGSMGTSSFVLAGPTGQSERAFGSACHGAGRMMSRHAALRQWKGREVQDELAERGIIVKSPSSRGIAEEAPGAYKDSNAVVEVTERAGLARRVARLAPLICIKG